MPKSAIRSSFPKTQPPPEFAVALTDVFWRHEAEIGTVGLRKGLTSNEVLAVIRADLVELRLNVEAGKQRPEKIQRPVFFGENGEPTLVIRLGEVMVAPSPGVALVRRSAHPNLIVASPR